MKGLNFNKKNSDKKEDNELADVFAAINGSEKKQATENYQGQREQASKII